ncbi:hypothetical protein P3102_03435 [Amycolatopsis sp. QT-25]|uniref:hypothetical protein n=1 Tax=Amycolatopsis sp. QT-25 TaxID=3034022 RepID=UPI0023EB32EA|nr:hypothetical protein [Amycolatopsis sp. QT-25]WET80318.1 hypothetical protein P3102_03435 [Amycolatopsis sp. QT-25]
MAGGHQVDPQALTQAAKALRDIPKHALAQPLAAVKDIQLVAMDFGQGHQESYGPYRPAVTRLANMADSYLKAADLFAQKLDASGGKYEANEAETSQSVKATGR